MFEKILKKRRELKNKLTINNNTIFCFNKTKRIHPHFAVSQKL